MIRLQPATVLAALLAVAGCNVPWQQPVGAVALAGAASIVIIHRTPIDALFSLVAGRDCSIVYLDQLQDYCKPLDTPPIPLPYCTRSLANVDCWANASGGLGRPVADQPALTADQQSRIGQGWSFSGL